MKADSYFEIGSTHQVCQDYALAYADDEFAYAIISDGCTSSPNTDIGARLVSVIARDAILYLQQRNQAIGYQEYVPTLKELIIKKCLEVKGSLNLSVDAFDATLLASVVYRGIAPFIFGWGDGNFIIKYTDGVVRTISISYDNNMPYYLSYQMSHEKDLAYSAQQKDSGMHITENVFNFPMNDPRIGDTDWRNDFHHWGHQTGFSRELWTIIGKPSVSQIVVSSDGLQSFQFDPRSEEFLTNDKVFPLSDIYPNIATYKSPVGEFVVRRMKSLEKENRAKHIIHYDDVSCAAIILD
jgi:hypothetical protein